QSVRPSRKSQTEYSRTSNNTPRRTSNPTDNSRAIQEGELKGHITFEQAAERLGITEGSLNRRIDDGHLGFEEDDKGNIWIAESDIAKLPTSPNPPPTKQIRSKQALSTTTARTGTSPTANP